MLTSPYLDFQQAFEEVYVVQLTGFLSAVFCLIIPSKQLLSAYLYVETGIVIFWSYVMNEEYIKYCLYIRAAGLNLQGELFTMNQTVHYMFLRNYVGQAAFGIIFCFSSTGLPEFPTKKFFAGISFIVPTLLSIIPLPEYVLMVIPLSTTLFELSFLVHYLLRQRNHIHHLITEVVKSKFVFISNHGIVHVLTHFKELLNISELLKVFWIMRICILVVILLYDAAFAEFKENGEFTLSKVNLIFLIYELLAQSCDTFLAVSGMSCILTSMLQYIVEHFQSFLFIPSNSQQNRVPPITIVFLALAIQTGLTGLEPQERTLRLYRNIMKTISATSHYVQEDVHFALISLTYITVNNLSRHIRAVACTVLVIAYSCCLLFFLLKYHVCSAWFLSVCAFSVETTVKAFLSLMMYILNVIDSKSTVLWENYDDYMFYIMLTSYISTFFMSIFVCFTGIYILFYESFGITRIALITSHLYFNIWCQIKDGWHAYEKKKAVEARLESLPAATLEQLKALDDVCSVCHQEMKKAKLTGCNHYFHTVCLRRWLYENYTCPICYKII